VLVQRGDVEDGLGRALQDVADLDRDAVGELPASDVVARERRRVGLPLQAERSKLGVPRGGVADVARGAAADLEESDWSTGWEHLIDGLADERLRATAGQSHRSSRA